MQTGLAVEIEIMIGKRTANCVFSIPAGGVHAIVGPSAAGKTTLLRAILGTVSPLHGVIRFQGQTWFDGNTSANLAPRLRRVGMVFQDYALFSHMTVHENVFFAEAGLSFDREQWLEKFHIEQIADRYPQDLSGGEKQRVAIARALWAGPQLLLLDEPFSALDRMLRNRLREQVEELVADLRIPVLLVSHDLDEVKELCSTVSVLIDGKIAQQGATSQVYDQPVSRAVAEFLGWRNIFAVDQLLELASISSAKKYVAIPETALNMHEVPNAIRIPLTVERTKTGGSERIVHARTKNRDVIVFRDSAAGSAINTGEQIVRWVERSRLVYFDQ